jgi:hypothetical protein
MRAQLPQERDYHLQATIEPLRTSNQRASQGRRHKEAGSLAAGGLC